MNDLSFKFNLYDHLAYILVGLYQLFVLWVLYILIFNPAFTNMFEFLKIEFSVALIFISYLIGHLVQATSNLFEKWEKAKKEENKKSLSFVMNKARDFFDLPKELSEKDVWQYCYLFALSNDFSGHVALFNSMYSLYRGFWIASSIGFAASSLIVIIQVIVFFMSKYQIYPDWRLTIFILVTFGLGILFSKRKKRFFDYMEEKTLITFDILSKKLLYKKL